MKASELKVGNKITLKLRATITTASCRNDDRVTTVKEISKISYSSTGSVDYINFKGMKNDYRVCGEEVIWLYSLGAQTREYTVI